MKPTLLLLLSLIALSCSRPKIFVLNDSLQNKYAVSTSIEMAIDKNQIGQSPLIVIDGIPFKYNKKQDTITLPFNKSDLIRLDFLNKNSSRIIYNDKEEDGAIIITTKTQPRDP